MRRELDNSSFVPDNFIHAFYVSSVLCARKEDVYLMQNSLRMSP